MEREIWAHVPAEHRGQPHDSARDDELVGYGPDGLPGRGCCSTAQRWSPCSPTRSPGSPACRRWRTERERYAGPSEGAVGQLRQTQKMSRQAGVGLMAATIGRDHVAWNGRRFDLPSAGGDESQEHARRSQRIKVDASRRTRPARRAGRRLPKTPPTRAEQYGPSGRPSRRRRTRARRRASLPRRPPRCRPANPPPPAGHGTG